jgi:heptosyltransferase II
MGPIVLVRAPNWLGDTVMALPALRGLRAGLPEARIALVGRWAPLLRGQGVADLLLPYPRSRRERRGLTARLREDPADLALLLVNSFEAAWAALRWGARRRVGYAVDWRRALLTDALPLPTPRLHQVDEYAAVVRALGLAAPAERPEWRRRRDPSDEAEVSALLAQAGADPGAPLVGLHLGAAFGPSKLWPLPSFGGLADRLADAGYAPLLIGGPEDLGAAAEVQRAARRPLASAVGRDRPALLPELLARLRCLVSGDTGVAHLAAALGVPTVTLFGPTDQRLTAPRSSRAHVLDRAVSCAPCFLPTCPIDHVCLRTIGVEDVTRAVREAAPP